MNNFFFKAGPTEVIYQDLFWQATLRGIDSFQAAMNFYRDLFRTITNCASAQCQCVEEKIDYDFTFYFINERNFKEFVRLIEPVKNKYTPRTIDQVNADVFVVEKFDARTPTLSNFVLKYDWANALSVHYYDDVQKCLLSKNAAQITALAQKCGGTGTGTVIGGGSDDVVVCSLKEYNCPDDVKNYMVTGFIFMVPNPSFDSIYDRVTFLTSTNFAVSTLQINSFVMLATLLVSTLVFYFH